MRARLLALADTSPPVPAPALAFIRPRLHVPTWNACPRVRSDGDEFPCPGDTYGYIEGAPNKEACQSCPPFSRSPARSTSKEACLCERQRFFDPFSAECNLCPNGADCTSIGAFHGL